MHWRTWLVSMFAFFATLAAPSPAQAADTSPQQPDGVHASADGVRALDGVWIFVEDRTEGRATEQQQPSMSAKVTPRIEPDAVVLVRRDGEVRMPIDGSATEVLAKTGSRATAAPGRTARSNC